MIVYQFFNTFVGTMAQKEKPDITADKLGKNPFLEALKIKVSTLTMHGQYKTDKEGLVLPVEVELESDKYCRVYVDGVRRKEMVELSPRAKDLLLWVMYEIDNAKDYIRINREKYMKECGIRSYNTYKEALNDLIRKRFLGPSVMNGVYWINPNFFFNGSRINKFPKNLKK